MTHPVLALTLSGGLLAACVAGAGFGSSRATPLLQGAFSIGTPAGYCVDKSASQEVDDTAIVLMGRCSAKAKVAPAIITVSVGRAGSAGVMATGGAGLARYFTSEEGRAALSRRGRPAEIRVVEALTVGDAFLMRLREPGVGEYWRAVLGQRGRLVMLSVMGPEDVPLGAEPGRALLDQALDALRRANRG